MTERTSSLSVASKFGAVSKVEVNYNEISDNELRASLDEVSRVNRILTIENEVIEQFLRRKDPRCLEKLPLIVESARQAQKISRLRTSVGSGGRGAGSSTLSLSGSYAKSGSTSSLGRTGASGSQQLLSVATASTKGLKLTSTHRIELANKEVELMRKEYEDYERKINEKRSNIEICLEELKYRIKDSTEATEKFENEVVRQVDPITKKLSEEKFLKFIDDQSKLAAMINDKLNLKMITTRRLIRETKKQIESREEMGKTLRPIDFEQVAIETEYLMDENEMNNRSLRKLKRISRHYNLTLKYHKEELNERKARLGAIERDLISKERENAELRVKEGRARREAKKALSQLSGIKELQENYEKPEVVDFLQVQRQLQEEMKKFKRLRRRRKIQLFTLGPKMKK